MDSGGTLEIPSLAEEPLAFDGSWVTLGEGQSFLSFRAVAHGRLFILQGSAPQSWAWSVYRFDLAFFLFKGDKR